MVDHLPTRREELLTIRALCSTCRQMLNEWQIRWDAAVARGVDLPVGLRIARDQLRSEAQTGVAFTTRELDRIVKREIGEGLGREAEAALSEPRR